MNCVMCDFLRSEMVELKPSVSEDETREAYRCPKCGCYHHVIKETEKQMAPWTPIDLDELEKLAKEATPGPWDLREGDDWWDIKDVVSCGSEGEVTVGIEDARFIAAVNPSTILALIAVIRELQADVIFERKSRYATETALVAAVSKIESLEGK